MPNPPNLLQTNTDTEGDLTSMVELKLMSTSACHLCDQAKALCDSLLNPEFFRLSVVDIAESDELIERFGTRIPVLCRVRDGVELGWPFDADQIIEFLS